MLKLITSGKENSIYRLFHGFENKYDGWTLNNPAVFEYIKKKYNDNNYFVSASFVSGGDDERDYLLVFLKKNTDYFITCPLYGGEEDEDEADITRCQMQIYDYKKKVYSNDNIGLEKIGDVLQFGPETTNGKTKLLHVVNLSKDTYCLFEIWMNEPFENSKKRVLNINFFRNIPSGGNYTTRYFRDFRKIESNKWSLSGKVYARKSIRDIGRSIESEDLEDGANYEQGVIIETLSEFINFESFEEAEMVFQPEHKKIWQNVIFNEIVYDLQKIFGSGTYKTLKITGYIETEQDEEQRFYIQYGSQNHVGFKINDLIYFSDGENSDSITTDHVQLKKGMNPFVIYLMMKNGNTGLFLKKITDDLEYIDNVRLFHVSSQ